MKPNIDILFRSYEKLAKEDISLALEEMIHLYFSNDELSHEVSDAIELWVYEKGTEKTLEIIKNECAKHTRLLEIAEEGLRK